MRRTVRQQTAPGLPLTIQDAAETYPRRDPVVRTLERRTWWLGHGHVSTAFHTLADRARERDGAAAIPGAGLARNLLKPVEACHTSIDRQRTGIPHDGARYRYGECSRTGVVDATVPQRSSQRFGTR